MVRSRMSSGNWKREWDDEQRLTPQERAEEAKREAEAREMEEWQLQMIRAEMEEENREEMDRLVFANRADDFDLDDFFPSDPDDLSHINDDCYESDIGPDEDPMGDPHPRFADRN
jgi:hypothetical protein